MLLADCFTATNFRLDDLLLTPNTAVALLVSTSATAACPRCGSPSDRVHRRYRRTVADLPCPDRTVALRLVVRRFRCPRPDCPRGIFCERLPGLLRPHARSTDRLSEAHRAIGPALGGAAGARLADRLDMPASPDTLLRRVKDHAGEPAPRPRHVGIDDRALRKGQHYGTIVVDRERGRVLDILPGRDGEALKGWLKEHPEVEVISRDRWAAYAQAAAEAAPQARQVADRWHLLKNLREMLERLLGRLAPQVREVLSDTPTPTPVPATTAGAVGTMPLPEKPAAGVLPPTQPAAPPSEPARLPPRRQARQAKRQARQGRHQQVRQLHSQGLPLREIARRTGLSRKAVRRYCREGHCPDWNPGRSGGSQLHAHREQIEGWLRSGEGNTAGLYRQLQAAGCQASYDAVRRFVNRRRGSTGKPGPRTGTPVPPPVPPPSARHLSFEAIRRAENRDQDGRARMDKLRAMAGVLPEALAVADEFAAMVRQQSKTALSDWLSKAEGSSCVELRGFAAGPRQDEAAVAAALTERWSNGPVEGQVNRLKLIKRQMYGRAGFPLLRARVRFAS